MSPEDQDTIDCEYLAYFEPKKIKMYENKKFYKKDFMQLFSEDTTIFFQYCQWAKNQPKSHILFHKKGSLRNFYIMTLVMTKVDAGKWFAMNILWG